MKTEKNENLNNGVEIKKGNLKRNLMLFFLIFFIGGVVLLYQYAKKPAEGIVKTTSNDQKAQIISQDVPEVFVGKHLSFMYDSSYKVKSREVAEKEDAVILERAYLSQASVVSKKISLMVRNLPTQILDDCPDFKMRSIKKENYKKEEFDFGNISGTSFEATETGTYEKTVFLLHKDFLVIITLTAPSFSDEKLEEELKTIIKSVSWLK